METTILQKAIAAEPFKGNQSRFADAIGTSQQNVSNWLRKNARLPAEYVHNAARVTGIPPHQWRPDVFGPAAAQGEAA